jgi:hypothetical protein
VKPSEGKQGSAARGIQRRRRGLVIAAITALLAVAIAAVATAAEKPVTVRVGELELTVNGGVTPKALSKTKMEPISLNVSGEIAEANGSHPPALTEVVVDTDKNGTIDLSGAPECKQGQLEARTTAQAEQVCGPAILGTGTTDVEVLFAESKPVMLHSKLLAFNGGTKGGTTTIYIHAFLSTPVTAAVVTTVKISKEHKGPYGVHSVATIPKIASYAGSVTAFNLTFKKKLFTYKGKKHGYLMAKCPTGKFLALAEAKFHDGTKVGPAKLIRPCTPKG